MEKGAAQCGLRGAKRCCEFVKTEIFFRRLREKISGALDERDGAGNLIGAAAQAGAVAVFFSFFARAEESDVAAQGPARRARRAAIDVRRAHGENESAVGARIAGTRGAPVARGGVLRDGWGAIR